MNWSPILAVAAVIYLLPSFIAICRVQKVGVLDVIAIILLNVLLGWLVVGWVLAMFFAFGPRTYRERLRMVAYMGHPEFQQIEANDAILEFKERGR
jgi:hypothetical protein